MAEEDSIRNLSLGRAVKFVFLKVFHLWKNFAVGFYLWNDFISGCRATLDKEFVLAALFFFLHCGIMNLEFCSYYYNEEC